MKKITLLILLTIIPIVGFSQVWDFNNSADGWTNLASTKTTTPTYWELTSKVGVNNPGLRITPPVPAVDVNTVSILAITMKNLSATGPEEIRASASTSGDAASGNKFVSIPISRGDTEYQTYYIDFSGSKWIGTVDEMKILFKAVGNTNYAGTGAEVFDIDKIEMISSIPLPIKNDYTFDVDNDTEGWAENNSTLSVSGGVATIVPNVGVKAKIVQNNFAVDAVVDGYVHIFYKNESALNNQIRVQFTNDADGYTTYKGKNENINQSMAVFEELVIDLTGVAEWQGLTHDFQIIIRDTNNGNNASAGNLIIDRVVFSPGAVLSTSDIDYRDDVSLTLYPNPVKDVLNINSPLVIVKVEVFNLLGQKTISTSSTRINTEDLAKGIYIVKVTQENNVISTKRFIKQ